MSDARASGKALNDWTISEAAAWRAGAEAMRAACANACLCGCDHAEQARVVAAAIADGPNSVARWRACHRTVCLALLAAELLYTPIPDMPARLPEGSE